MLLNTGVKLVKSRPLTFVTAAESQLPTTFATAGYFALKDAVFAATTR